MLDAQDLLGRIRGAFRAGQYEVSRHAALRMLRRAIQLNGWIGGIEGDRNMAARCPACGGAEEVARVTFTAILEGTLLTIEEVPALLCRQCGEETFSAETMKRIEAFLASRPRPARVAEVPVYVLDAA